MTHFVVMFLSQKNMPGWEMWLLWLPSPFDGSSLDQCLFVLFLSCLHASPFSSFREAGDLHEGSSRGPAIVLALHLQLTCFKGQLHLSEALHDVLCPRVMFCTFQSPSHRYTRPVRAVGAGIGTSLLQTRETEAQRLQVTFFKVTQPSLQQN